MKLHKSFHQTCGLNVLVCRQQLSVVYRHFLLHRPWQLHRVQHVCLYMTLIAHKL